MKISKHKYKSTRDLDCGERFVNKQKLIVKEQGDTAICLRMWSHVCSLLSKVNWTQGKFYGTSKPLARITLDLQNKFSILRLNVYFILDCGISKMCTLFFVVADV